jgi:hypothetical protein
VREEKDWVSMKDTCFRPFNLLLFIYLKRDFFFFCFLVWFLGMAKVEYILSMPVFVFFVFFF